MLSARRGLSFPRRFNATLTRVCIEQLEASKLAGTYKAERVIVTPQSAEVRVQGGSAPVLNFCANNYLGLSNNPELIEAAKKSLDTHGFGLSSVRFICGTQDIHKQLEKRISEFHGLGDTILFPSGFDANAGLFEALLGAEDAIISDELNHASIIDGIRLCKAKRFRYKHLDVADLEAKLIEAKDARMRLIATDGVFSMDGDVAPLAEIRALADKYDAILMIDECHAGGHLGATGRGTPELTGVKVDIITSTLGKALGGATGGYCSASPEVVDLLRNKARTYLFSNSVAPSVVAASLKAFELVDQQPQLMKKLQDNTKYFRDAMNAAGFEVLGHPNCPIAPILLRDAKMATEFANRMLQRDIYVIAFSFPVVPKGTARIRVQLSAAHTREQLEKAVAAFTEVGKEIGVLK